MQEDAFADSRGKLAGAGASRESWLLTGTGLLSRAQGNIRTKDRHRLAWKESPFARDLDPAPGIASKLRSRAVLTANTGWLLLIERGVSCECKRDVLCYPKGA